ncbi:stage III sporulation protein AH [Gottschalkia acidurici 9a]|uniref:Stage III sporulation protein AH n=1 Tax=Gottschalkia acidurici (strain ATCC 7906 / DSM 604 / BCRC 14475 / CIP 104303 / KCTC 5404 / NCIMB 10678 / 9a) TaxID=1128398 RepID=K0AYS0_GOTA9|nr:SpoIIIAH-like family protein [Gottschalkia acidurici]AFS78389.1 stage III sporulation protein AH [Gottschalkia acidurici 9a]
MFMKKFLKKRSVLVSSLVFLLGVVGYFNHQLTQKSLLQSSNEYAKHEEMELSSLGNSKDGNTQETSTKNVEVIDSKGSKDAKLANYFVEHRLSRDKLRGESVERLNKMIEDEKTVAEVRTNAQKELISIGENSEMELYIEGLIKGKGFADALVFLNKDSARIVVDKEELEETDVMKILEIVTTETELDSSNIKIMKKQ